MKYGKLFVLVAIVLLAILLVGFASGPHVADAQINVPPTDPPPLALSAIVVDPPDGVAEIDALIGFTAVYTDPPPPPELNFYTATYAWGDGTTSTCPHNSAACTVEPGIGGIGLVTGSHVYGEPGVYTMQLTLRDRFDRVDTSTFEFVVAYDPDGGFVTGGGWIDSPAGAYKPDPSLTGKASFGFVSKYKKGANRPTGNTHFQFQTADLNFHSASYDWLVVTGSDYAMFKGVGTINGAGEYNFRLWAGDDDPDTFRIKIWEEDESGVETVIYDNGSDQAIGGGSITVHTGKDKK